MNTTIVRSIAAGLLVVALAACAGASKAPAPAAAAPSTDVNPITGSRGGSGAGSAR